MGREESDVMGREGWDLKGGIGRQGWDEKEGM
mgnify:FL=1